MPFASVAIALALLTIGMRVALAAELVTLAVKGQPAENGKVLNMDFREVERTDSASIVEVKFESGGSVSSSMFVLRGQCAVARARGKQYFRSDDVPGRPSTYRISFPTDMGGVESQTRLSKFGVFSLEECAQLGF